MISTPPNPINATTLNWDDVDPDLRVACVELWHSVWPEDDAAGPEARLTRTEPIYAALDGMQLHLAFDDTSLRAVARTFLHTVTLDGEPLEIVALASVCSDPDHRGEGWGDAVVNAAFDRVTELGRPALFQSPVPKFYERFGSRVITNEVMTSVGAKAFYDPFVMIHPGDSPWDDNAVIDLQAPGW